MTRLLFTTVFLLTQVFGFAQKSENYIYEPSETHPYGRLNPKAPPQTADFAMLIGQNGCKSLSRKQDGTWSKDSIDMIWRFKYIFNGMAVMDETLKADGTHSGSVRQYNADSARWYVTYFSSSAASPSPGVWSGNKEGEKIILYRKQQAPNGKDGFYRLTFQDISENSFNWRGEWVDTTESFVYPTWLIFCEKEP